MAALRSRLVCNAGNIGGNRGQRVERNHSGYQREGIVYRANQNHPFQQNGIYPLPYTLHRPSAPPPYTFMHNNRRIRILQFTQSSSYNIFSFLLSLLLKYAVRNLPFRLSNGRWCRKYFWVTSVFFFCFDWNEKIYATVVRIRIRSQKIWRKQIYYVEGKSLGTLPVLETHNWDTCVSPPIPHLRERRIWQTS